MGIYLDGSGVGTTGVLCFAFLVEPRASRVTISLVDREVLRARTHALRRGTRKRGLRLQARARSRRVPWWSASGCGAREPHGSRRGSRRPRAACARRRRLPRDARWQLAGSFRAPHRERVPMVCRSSRPTSVCCASRAHPSRICWWLGQLWLPIAFEFPSAGGGPRVRHRAVRCGGADIAKCAREHRRRTGGLATAGPPVRSSGPRDSPAPGYDRQFA
jgi:hypothetical protein